MADPQVDSSMGFLDSLGARSRRRAEPRTSIAVAGAGCALAILGVLIVAGDTGASDGDFNRVPGILLSALVVAAGFGALSQAERGAVATAGAVAAALGVPPLMFFLTVDEGTLPPYSTEGILFVSTIAWFVAYAVGPGRGRPLFLGLGLVGLWFSLLQLTEEVFDAPFVLLGGFTSTTGETDGESTLGGDVIAGGLGQDVGSDAFHVPDPTTIGVLSLLLGLGYLIATRWLDRRGHHGAAQPFALATIPVLLAGTVALADDLEQAGTGLLLLLIGLALAYHGATTRRRGSAWVGGAATAVGAAVFLGDMADDATVLGLLYLTAGIGLVVAGHALGRALDEPDELAVTDPAFVVAAAPVVATVPPPPDDDSPWRPPDDTRPPPPS